MASDDDVPALTRRIAAFGLPRSGPPTVVRGVRDDEWRGVLGDVTRQRLTGLALAAVEAGALELSPAQIDALTERHRGAMIHALRLEQLLLNLADAFEAEGVDMVVLKGPAVAHGFYPDPSWRPFGDLDVLVRSRDWRAVGAVLGDLGFPPKFPEPRPGFRERFGHTEVHADDTGIEIDLHRILVAGPFGLWTDRDELFGRTTTFRLGGGTLRRLDDPAVFLHGCIHASLGARPSLFLPLRDVVQLSWLPAPDWPAIEELARRWRLRAVVQHALASAAEILAVRLPAEAERTIHAATPPRSERRALEAYTTARRERGGKAIASLRAIRGIGGKAAYLRALLLPDREFLAFREGGVGWASLRARWSRPARWLVRR